MRRDLFAGIIVPLSILLPIGIFIPRYKYASKELKAIFYYLVMVSLISFVAIVLKNQKINNLPLLHVYTILEAGFIFYYFKTVFKNEAANRIINFLMVVFPALCIVNFSFFQSIYKFNTYTRPLEAILITILCIIYFFKSGFFERWIKMPVNWINMGIMSYFPAASIIFILSNTFVFKSYDRDLNILVWDLHALLVLIMYLLFAKAFSLIRVKPEDNT